MSKANGKDEKTNLPGGRHRANRLTDGKLRELFAELAEPLPSEQLSEKDQAMIRAMTAKADEEAKKKKTSFADKEEIRKKPSGFERE